MTLTKLSFVVFLAATALPRLTSVHAQQAQQPRARRPGAFAQVDLSGKWRFGSFGSFWVVDLKLDPKQTTADEKVYCGEALRDRLTPDTPIIKAQVCAEIDPDSGQMLVEVHGAACRASYLSQGMMDGTCTQGGAMGMMKMDPAAAGSMTPSMGGFTAIRVVGSSGK